MYIKLGELRGKRADKGLPSRLEDVAEATGIALRMVEKISAGKVKQYRCEYIDALCAFFECTPNELIAVEPVELPLNLNIRPDRQGVRVGVKTAKEES